jgi:hypothetical protein
MSRNTIMIKVWINDFVIPLRVNPASMCVRFMDDANISFSNPNYLSSWMETPAYKQVRITVMDIMPPAVKVT